MDTSIPDAAQLVPALEHAVDHLPSSGIPALIGDLERLQALLSARLLRESWQAAASTRAAPTLEDLQHLTPAQVAELINLTEPYVHELCRTGRVQATKSGKYWMVPVAGLRAGMVVPKHDVDGPGKALLTSSPQRQGGAPSHPTPPARRSTTHTSPD